MSWLGEQISSFTGKITDFTKEVLIDDSSAENIDSSNRSGLLSYKELLDICEEKDKKINSLSLEKEYLEKSIEELDQQHQEAIDALILQKNNAVAENNTLKERISSNKHNYLETSNSDFHLLYGSSDVSNNIKTDASENQSSELNEEDINLISILQSVSDCSEDEKFKKQIHWLEKQKNLSHVNTKNITTNLINKIDTYINFLEALHSQSLYSVVDEICSIFNVLASENDQLRKKLKAVGYCGDGEKIDLSAVKEGNQSNDHYQSELENKFCEAFSQTNVCESQVSSVSTQTFVPEDIKSSPVKNVHPSVSKTSQTEKFTEEEGGDNIIDKNAIIDKLKSDMTVLEEKLKFQQTMCQSPSLSKNLTFSANTQTDKSNFKNTESELSSQSIIAEYEEACNNLQLKYSQDIEDLNDKLKSRTSTIIELETQVQSLQSKINSLEDIIKDLKNTIKKYQHKDSTLNAEENLRNQKHFVAQQQKFEETQNEITLLQAKLKNSELEKGKLLSVLNEKTKECSSLKAEVHKLTSIVASEKQALSKLQQDNCELKQLSAEKSDPELTKEAIKKLSSIIKDKDLEIESLKQKNSTLTTLIQNVTSVPEHMQSLMEEKENLSKQIKLSKAERDKIMLSYNAKDKEWRDCSAEVKKLNSLLTNRSKEFDMLEQNHCSVAQQYEEKQKSLINAQNEMVILKQQVDELRQQLTDMKEKHSDLLNKINSDSTIQITKEELYEKNTKIENLTCSNEEKDHLIQEKDCMIHDLSQQVKKLKLESEQQMRTSEENQEKIGSLIDKVKEANMTTERLEKDKAMLEQRFQDKTSELDLLKEMNERLNMNVKEKEFAVQSMTEKISSLSQYISSGPSSSGTADVHQILADSESMFSEAQKCRRERDETLLALNQCKQENQSLRNEIQRMKSNEIHLENQLARLRQHLLEVEENYTNEALKAEEKERDLKDELVEVKRRADITSTAVVDTNQRASIQIASLQEQLSMVANQRDEALSLVSSLEDKVLHHSTAVSKLQLVLEQMQKSNERKLKEVDNKWQSQLEKHKETVKQLEKQLQMKQMQLEESSKALEAASRLSEQLDAKEEVIANLKSELSKTENKIKSTALEIHSIKSNTEGKVDRVVMKSLVLGYFSTPPGQKSEVVRLLARVLDFNQEEMEKAGIVVGRPSKNQENRGIFSSIFNRLPSLGSPERLSRQPEKSFTTLFVQFLENESQPIVPMPFPAEEMAQELTSKTHPNKKSLTASGNSSPRRSPLLMDIDSAFPTFTPLPAVEYATSPAILKEVLE